VDIALIGGTYPVQAWNTSGVPQLTLVDNGLANYAVLLKGGLNYNYTNHSLVFTGQGYAQGDTLMVGMPTQMAQSSVAIQNGFSILTDVRVTSLQNTTIWSMSGTALPSFLKLTIVNSYFTVIYYRGMGAVRSFTGPLADLQTRINLLVRCEPYMLMCVLSTY
jgi:hypothetical protein